jgi:hypothetical protein
MTGFPTLRHTFPNNPRIHAIGSPNHWHGFGKQSGIERIVVQKLDEQPESKEAIRRFG